MKTLFLENQKEKERIEGRKNLINKFLLFSSIKINVKTFRKNIYANSVA